VPSEDAQGNMPCLHQPAPEGHIPTMSHTTALSGCLRHTKDPQMTLDISVYATELSSEGGTNISKWRNLI